MTPGQTMPQTRGRPGWAAAAWVLGVLVVGVTATLVLGYFGRSSDAVAFICGFVTWIAVALAFMWQVHRPILTIAFVAATAFMLVGVINLPAAYALRDERVIEVRVTGHDVEVIDGHVRANGYTPEAWVHRYSLEHLDGTSLPRRLEYRGGGEDGPSDVRVGDTVAVQLDPTGKVPVKLADLNDLDSQVGVATLGGSPTLIVLVLACWRRHPE